MTSLPELLLLSCFVLVHIDCAQLPVTPLSDRPFSVLEWPRHFFLLKIGDQTDKVSMPHLKLDWTLADKEQVPLLMRASGYSAMAQLQQSCPDVASMLTSDNLHITSQVVGGVPLMGDNFNRGLPSSGTRTDAGGCFLVPTLHPPPRGAGDAVPHHS
jgi:hypothetical protein